MKLRKDKSRETPADIQLTVFCLPIYTIPKITRFKHTKPQFSFVSHAKNRLGVSANKTFGPNREAGENYKSCFKIWTIYLIMSRILNQGGWNKRDFYYAWGKRNAYKILVRFEILTATCMRMGSCTVYFGRHWPTEELTASITTVMKAVSSSETSDNVCQTILCNIPEDSHLHTKCWKTQQT
jgi:hypothetical protein